MKNKLQNLYLPMAMSLCAVLSPSAEAIEIPLLADTYISDVSTEIATPYGQNPILITEMPSSLQKRQTLLKFRALKQYFPANTVVTDISRATLHIWIDSVSGVGNIKLIPILSDWNEKTVTTNTAPTINDSLALTYTGSSPGFSGWYSINITSFIRTQALNNNLSFVLQTTAGKVIFSSKESTTSKLAHLDVTLSSQGIQGLRGLTGSPGAAGIKGDKGDKGDTGLTGATGAKGDTGAKGATGSTGATGLTGLPGVKGDKGDTGLTGAKGDTGATGLTGLPGVKGDTGDTGLTGLAGTNGNSILNGSGIPTTIVGVNGDFYIDIVANKIYGPKTTGTWTTGTSLVGATGPNAVSTTTTTPLNSVLKGNGTNVVEAVAGTDYLTPTGDGSGLTNLWKLAGNTGTSASTHFIGTTDSAPLTFKVNNTKAGFISLVANSNTYFGYGALLSTTGTNNIALGYQAGSSLTNESGNIHIGHVGVTGDNSLIRIGTNQAHTYLSGIIHGTGLQIPTNAGVNKVLTSDANGVASWVTPTTGSGTGTVTNVTATAPISVATGASTPAISMARATSAADGYLSATDWTTFNNKVTGITAANSNITIGGTPTSPTIGFSGSLADAQIVDTLTMNGGSIAASLINSSSIGSLTPSTGTFTAVTTDAFKLTTGSGTAGKVLTSDTSGNAAWTSIPTLNQNTTGSAKTFTDPLAGDITGNQGATIVSKIQGVAVSVTPPTISGQVLTYSGTQWEPATASSSGGLSVYNSSSSTPNTAISNVKINIGTMPATATAGTEITATFNSPFSSVPVCTVSVRNGPVSASTNSPIIKISLLNTTTIKVMYDVVPAGTTSSIHYICIGA